MHHQSPLDHPLQARELAWDVERQALAPLEPLLLLRLHNEATRNGGSWGAWAPLGVDPQGAPSVIQGINVVKIG